MGFDAWIRARAQRRPAWEVLGRRVVGVCSWNVNDTCNYRCSYCTQRFMPQRTYRLAEIRSALDAFAQLPGCWEIKMSGGEPFQQPGLVEIAAGLVERGHLVSVQTNLSAPPDRLAAFLDATRGALHILSASLHLEYASVETFIRRYAEIRPYEAHGVRFNVTSVGTPDRLQHLRDHVAPALRAAGIPFKVQPEKVRGYVREYGEAERDLLLSLGGHNGTGKIENDFQGRLCHAGVNYVVIKSTGEAFRCYAASRVGGRYARLGSLSEGLTLLGEAQLCPYTYCNCTVPIERGMIAGAGTPEDTLCS